MLTDSGVAPMAAVGGVPRPKPDGAEVPRPATAQRRDETATQRLVRAEGAVREATHALDASADRRADLETERDGLERRRAEIDRLLREERDQRSEAEARLRKARSELRAARMTLGRAPTPGAER
ncbi:MAG: hypothetical protein GX868_08770 [Actinobacteria bacterium]|nr:hypothetical protein [Actinomycetota bacterium]